MNLGIILNLTDHLEPEFMKCSDLGFHYCQLNGWNPRLFTDETARQVKDLSLKYKVEVTSFWCGWGGPAVWDFVQGPLTLGLVPPAYRQERLQTLKQGADFSTSLGVKNIITHAGFIPENLTDPEYLPVLETLRDLAEYCRMRRLNFLFETGQETPVVLLRVIEDIGLDNVGVNLDPANLILYGKGNPVDALDVIGKYVWDVHAKDGLYPTSGRSLGQEVPIGQGQVNFPLLLARLKALGYDGMLTIEREITGEQQTRDILAARQYLESLI